MTEWELAAAALVPALAIPLLAASCGRTGDRLAAIQLASSVSTVLLAVMTFAFDQSSYVAAGAVLVAVAFLADGPSTRAWKVLLTVMAGVVGGAVLSHASGRALLYRDRFRQPEPPT